MVNSLMFESCESAWEKYHQANSEAGFELGLLYHIYDFISYAGKLGSNNFSMPVILKAENAFWFIVL
jgi:hypothetical protein